MKTFLSLKYNCDIIYGIHDVKKFVINAEYVVKNPEVNANLHNKTEKISVA